MGIFTLLWIWGRQWQGRKKQLWPHTTDCQGQGRVTAQARQLQLSSGYTMLPQGWYKCISTLLLSALSHGSLLHADRLSLLATLYRCRSSTSSAPCTSLRTGALGSLLLLTPMPEGQAHSLLSQQPEEDCFEHVLSHLKNVFHLKCCAARALLCDGISAGQFCYHRTPQLPSKLYNMWN